MKRIFVDTETTGTDKEIHAIHQLSGHIEIDGNVVETFDFKIRPYEGAVINPIALKVANVSYEQIMQYPPETEGYFEFKNMLTRYVESFDRQDKFVFIGYNAKFDLEMINEMFLRNGNKFFFSLVYSGIVDVMTLFVEKFENGLYLLDNFKLMTVAKFLEIPLDETKLHNSLYDIDITREIFYKLKTIDYSFNHIEINELKKFWERVYPRLVEDGVGKCIITATPKGINPFFELLDVGTFYNLNVFWETSKPVVENLPTETDIFYNKLYMEQQEYESNIPEPTYFEKLEFHTLNQEHNMDPVSAEFLKSQVDGKPAPKPMIKVKLDYVMTFGKNKGRSIEQIMLDDAQYILWLDMEHPFGIFVPIDILNDANRLTFEQKEKWIWNKKQQAESNFLTKKGKFDDIENLPEDDLPF